MKSSTRWLCPLLALALPATGGAAECLGPAMSALGKARYADAIRAADDARAKPACARRRVDIELIRAMALLRVAHAVGGPTWCVARDAYAPFEASADPEIARGARKPHRDTDEACRAYRVQQAERDRPSEPQPPAPALNHWWLTGPGLGLLASGGVLLGLGIDAQIEASDLAEQIEAGDATGDVGARQRRAEGRATGFLVGGGALLGASAALLAGAYLSGALDGLGEAQVYVGPGSAGWVLPFW